MLRANNVDLETNTLIFVELKRIKDSIPIPESKKVSKGSLLICTASGSKAHLGKVALIDADYGYAFGGFMGQLSPNDSLIPKYFYYALTSESYKQFISELSDGANINNLKFSQLERFEIPVPSIEEQQRIVAILDEAYAGIATATANAEKNLQNSRELFESTLQSVFAEKGEDWVDSPLSELCSIKHGFAFKSQFFTSEGDYVLLTPGNFYEAGGYRDREEKQKYYVGEIPNDFILRKGDFLIAMTEQAAGLLGSSIIVPESNKFLHNQRLGLVRVYPGVEWNNEFFFHQFNTREFRKAVHDSASGVKVRHTSPRKLGDITVSFPKSEKDQKHIADRLDELYAETQRLGKIYKKKLIELVELKQSILQKAFAGELH